MYMAVERLRRGELNSALFSKTATHEKSNKNGLCQCPYHLECQNLRAQCVRGLHTARCHHSSFSLSSFSVSSSSPVSSMSDK